MASNTAGASTKAQYTAYKTKGQWRKNKVAKLEKRVLQNSADSSALELFEKGSKEYGRAKPGNKGWFPPQEAKLLREVNSEVETISKRAKEKLFRLREVYADKRPSAVRMQPIMPTLPPSPAKQLLDIGIINAKRYKTFRPSLGRIRRR